MSTIVCKFGGSSLADARQILKVKDIIESDANRRFIVVSAPGKREKSDQKVTDLLYLCHEHAKRGMTYDNIFDLIEQRYLQIVEDLKLDLDFKPQLDEVRGRIANEGPDYTASRGEALNGMIIAALLGVDFIDPADVIYFDANGRFDPENTQIAVAKRLTEHERAVIPGFYGSMPDGRVKTFSRGGSDVTGAIIARGGAAKVYENWTDVSGLLMADPRIIDQPNPIATVTYKELRELAYMGASVLHDEAIFPVRQAGIPVNIRNTNAPDDAGTMIVPNDRLDEPPTTAITGIAGRKDFTIIALEKALMNAELGYGRKLLEVFEDHGINFEHVPSGIDTISVVVADDELDGKLEDVLEDIRAICKPDHLEVHRHIALIATVGRGMAHHPGMAARLFGALGAAAINIRMIDQGSSELNIICGVEADDFEKAVSAIYYAFVEG
ncbi:aspartate kinase [Planctomycetales bacterium ZRK34]|nr:aspartate kinase [Planctomycetales bacterium ZRK34]